MIDTAKVTDRRALSFSTLDEVRAEMDRIIASERAGTLRRTGNWSVGQTFGHLAAWLEYPYTGYPMSPPWVVRMLARLFKKKFMSGSLPPGVRIRGAPAGTYGVDPMSLEAGAARLKAAMARMESTPPTSPNPLFGPLTHDEWKRLNLGHAALHLGFLHPDGAPKVSQQA